MQDVYLPIASALARPIRAPRSGACLHQLWRADFAALARLALLRKDAADAVRQLLWTHTALGVRERARRAQVERTRRFLRLPAVAPLLVSADWTHTWHASDRNVLFRTRMRVAFNGRIRIREHCFPGRREQSWWIEEIGGRVGSPTIFNVGLTLTGDAQGRLLVLSHAAAQRYDVFTGAFTDADGALCGLRWLTLLGVDHWKRIQPAEHSRLQRYARNLLKNLRFEPIIITQVAI
jgi:hypothetical protein